MYTHMYIYMNIYIYLSTILAAKASKPWNVASLGNTKNPP